MNLSTIRARVHRLRDLAHDLGEEVPLWKVQESPLLLLESKKYLEAIYDAIASTDEAAWVLEAAVLRLEKLNRETGDMMR